MRVLNAGDTTFIIEFGDDINQQLFAQVAQLNKRLHTLYKLEKLPGLIETVPTFRSLAVIFDPLITDPQTLLEQLDQHSYKATQDSAENHREWHIPVFYGGDHGPDLLTVSKQTGLSTDEVIAQHQTASYTVYMLGFLPGFAFMGDLPPSLHLARRSQPRTRVPAGSVGIAKQLTAVYPWDSPGGWHLLGHCPINFFNAEKQPPALLRPDDRVRFEAVSAAELSLIQRDIRRNTFDSESLLTS